MNCTNCGGVGRHIIVDGEGKQHSVTCQACGGSGQVG